MSSYRRYYLPRVSWSDVKGGVWRIQPYNVTDYFFIFRVQNLLTSAENVQIEKNSPTACFLIAGWLGENVQIKQKSPVPTRNGGFFMLTWGRITAPQPGLSLPFPGGFPLEREGIESAFLGAILPRPWLQAQVGPEHFTRRSPAAHFPPSKRQIRRADEWGRSL